MCGQPETVYHLFAGCTLANQIWREFLPIMKKILPPSTNLIQPFPILGIFPVIGAPVADFPYRLAFTMSSTIVHSLWVARVKHRMEGHKPSFQMLNTLILGKLTDIIKHKFHYHLQNGCMAEFKKRFAINQALCNVTSGRLLELNF